MGGPSNIHHATQLFERAGGIHQTQAIIMPIGKGVLQAGLNCSQDAVDNYGKMLISGFIDVWATTANSKGSKCQMAPADAPLQVPIAHISSAFKERTRQELIDYIYIVQGKNGSRYFKVGVANDYHQAATNMLHEVIHGYSIVFSGAVLKSVSGVFSGRLQISPHIKFLKVELPAFWKEGEEKKTTELQEATKWALGSDEVLQIGVFC